MKKHFTCANAALPTPPCNSHRTGTILSLALTLMLGWSANAWAYTTSNGSVTFAKDEVITIDFSGINTFTDFEDQGKLDAIISRDETIVTVKFKNNKTINNGEQMLHYQTRCNDWTWTHGGNEWFTLTTTASSATGGIPCPDKTSYTKLIVTDTQCNGSPTFTWSTGSTPPPTPTIPSVLQLDGNWSDRSWNNCQELTKNENVFTTTITVTSTNQFECCFKDNSCSAAALVKPNTQGVTYTGTNCTVDESSDENHNFTVTPSHTGNISITVTYGNNGAISVNFAQDTPPTPTDPCPNCKKITK